MTDLIKLEIRDSRVALVTINRPEALNALNRKVLQALDEVLSMIEQNKTIRAVVITGAGEKAFVAGADIAEMKEMKPAEAEEFSRCGQEIFARIKCLNQAVVAAVNGYALGGGCELAMACDLRVASENARFGQPEINLGIIPGFGGTVRLSRLVGPAKAREMIMTGAMITAEEALRIGLINRMVPAGTGQALEAALALAAELAAKPAAAMAIAKAATRESWDVSVEEAMRMESARFAETFKSPDQREGMTAHLEKRKPNWQ
ncbi:MAG TPA: crotonase [Firmicutes bacterium]|jgi:enoyl-CoA hydratase|nr:crotonase [Bacillota bacterium]